MIRLLLRLLGIKDFEVCQSCETLKAQLAYERDEKKRLTDTLIQILQPKIVESSPVEINQLQQTSALFSRRKAALEAREREDARVLRNSTNLGRPDDKLAAITDLEKELGIEEKGA